MPKITATLEYIDKTQYDMTPAFCLLLVDQRPDSKGKLSRLVITRVQRQQLVSQIDRLFGARLSAKNPNYTVGSAALIKKFLMDQLGAHKSADDPS
jgi:hypothetical protein